MPTFTLQAPDGRKVKIEAVDQATAMRGAQEWYASQGKAPAKPKPTLAQDVSGFMSNLNRSLVIGDEVTAAARTGVKALAGKVPVNALADQYKRELEWERQNEAQFAERNPVAAGIARGTGNSAALVIPGAPMVQGGRLANMGRGAVAAATTAAAYGALDAGTVQERAQAATRNALNPLVLAAGAGAGALSPAKARPPKAPTPRQGDVATLADIGVQTTAPQRAGGLMKQVEDLAMRFPIVGAAISGARNRQIEQLNRGVGLLALKPIGKGIPKTVQPGFEMVNYVDDAIGKVYDDAARLAPRVTPDEALADDLARIAERKVDLPENIAAQYDGIVNSRLARLGRGEVDGTLVKSIHGELGKLQAEAARKGEQTLAEMIGDTRRAVIGLIERASPEARNLIRRADEAWSVYSVMNDAAAAASNRGGVFLPGQLNTQARTSARAMGSNMAGKGRGTLQEVATAASRTLPDQYGNPGTANATALGAGGVGLVTAPVQTMAAGAGLTAAATPYFLAARRVIEALPEGATASQIQAAQRRLAELARNDPAVAAMQRELSARLARTAGYVGGQQSEPRNVLAASRQ